MRGDKFEQIQRLVGHHGEIWALAMSHTGDFIVSASHDTSQYLMLRSLLALKKL
jgi:hypothetical protein